MGWLSRLFRGQPPVATAAGARPAAADAAVSMPVETAASGPPLLWWLFDAPAPEQRPLSDPERRSLEVIDRLLALPVLPADLLPRSANVLPQLIAMLRQDDLPVSALAERIAKDPTVAAEVLRMASSTYFASQGPVQDLGQAIQRLGVEGLQMAISRVLLRPMYQARTGTLVADLAPRLWDHADVQSRLCAAQARESGCSAFDGYLVGLLHDTGWTVLLHGLQRAGESSPRRFSVDAVAAFSARAHQLFGRAAEAWAITPGFTAFAADARGTPLADSLDPMALALRVAQPAAMAELSTAA